MPAVAEPSALKGGNRHGKPQYTGISFTRRRSTFSRHLSVLRRYRDATYSLKVVVHQMEHQFKLQYDNDIDKFLDSIYAAGADLTGSDIEQRAKSIARSNQMLKLLESSIDLLRNNHKHGEQYYWILYYAFLSTGNEKYR